MDLLLDIINISKKYKIPGGYFEALKNVSFSIYKGEILALLGVNGAGKTTLSSILASLHPPTRGEIVHKNKSIYEDIIEYRMMLGYCPQRPNLDPYLTVWQNLVFAGRYFLLNKEDAENKANQLILQFDLEKYKNCRIDILSGGYKQRVLIARSLMHNPKIVILDEPTVGLDPHIRRDLWKIIKDLKNYGITIIITTHYLEEAEDLADRVCILDKGKMRLIDKPKNLKTFYQKGTLEDVFLQLMKEEAK